jgi:hypothetical protein
VTAIGGYAIDLNGNAKGGLNVWVDSMGSNASPLTTTETGVGWYFILLPPASYNKVYIGNSSGQIGTGKSIGNLTLNTFKQIDFTGLNPADPVIQGIVGTAEGGVAGVQVDLINVAGKVVGTTKTNKAGKYVFRFTQPGSYTVRITPPPGYIANPLWKTGTVKMFDEIWVDFLMEKL